MAENTHAAVLAVRSERARARQWVWITGSAVIAHARTGDTLGIVGGVRRIARVGAKAGQRRGRRPGGELRVRHSAQKDRDVDAHDGDE